MTITILPLRPGNAAALTQIMHRAVHETARADYSPEQLRAWSPRPMDPDVFLARLSDGRAVWVAFGKDAQPTGFIELQLRGHIDLFYCHPAGTGTGGALYAKLEAAARTRGLSRLTVDASETARRFFLRAGFMGSTRRQVSRHGTLLHTYPMSRALGQAAGRAPDGAHS